MNIEERAEKAVELKQHHGYNCCQSVTAVLADQTGMPVEQLSQIAAGFCVGMGNLEATCGSLIGAGMIAGLKTQGKGTVRYTKQMIEKFREKSGAVTCGDLKSIIDGKVLCPCEDCVRNAVKVYGEVMELQ